MHNLIEISLAQSVPVSHRVIPTKYNIIICLWSHAFHKLLEALRRASFSSPLALGHLQEFIYYALTFYTALFEEPSLLSFRSCALSYGSRRNGYEQLIETLSTYHRRCV